MLIDWFTVGAQIINFLILVWLMKRYLYKPIINGLDAREKLIAGKIADANQQQGEAQKKNAEFTAKSQAFDQQRADLLNQATANVAQERARLLEEAKKAATELSRQRQAAMQTTEQHLRQSIHIKTQNEVFAIAKKVLSDLSGVNLENRIIDVFIAKLQAIAQDEKSHLAAALKSTKEPILVSTGFDLSASQHTAIEEAIQKLVGSNRDIHFATTSDLIGGIELKSNGQKVAWSIAEFLGSLEQRVRDQTQDQKAAVN